MESNLPLPLQRIDENVHHMRDVLGRLLTLEPIRSDAMRAMGWEKALQAGYPDWYRAVDTDTLNDPAFPETLARLFRENPKAKQAQVGTLAQIMTAIYGHSHQGAPTPEHRAEHKRLQQWLNVVAASLIQADASLKPSTSKKPVANLSTFGGEFVDKQSLRDTRPLEILGKLVLQSQGRPLHIWQKTQFEVAKSIVTPQHSFLKSLWLNGLLATVISIAGIFGLADRMQKWVGQPQSMPPVAAETRADERTEKTLERPDNSAQTAIDISLFAGAAFLGIYLSLDSLQRRKTAAEATTKMAALFAHFGLDRGMDIASVINAAVGELAGLVNSVGAQAVDVVSDMYFVDACVKIAHNLWDRFPLRGQANDGKSIRDALKHATSGLLATFFAAGAYTLQGLVQTPLVAGYASAYGVYGVAKAVGCVKENVDKPRFWQRVGLGLAGIGMALGGLNGDVADIASHNPETPLKPTPTTLKNRPTEDLSLSQRATILHYYFSEKGVTLQKLQKLGGAAAAEATYTPKDAANFASRVTALTGQNVRTLADAKRVLAQETQRIYDALSIDLGGKNVRAFFTQQWQANNRDTGQMIEALRGQWQRIQSLPGVPLTPGPATAPSYPIPVTPKPHPDPIVSESLKIVQRPRVASSPIPPWRAELPPAQAVQSHTLEKDTLILNAMPSLIAEARTINALKKDSDTALPLTVAAMAHSLTERFATLLENISDINKIDEASLDAMQDFIAAHFADMARQADTTPSAQALRMLQKAYS